MTKLRVLFVTFFAMLGLFSVLMLPANVGAVDIGDPVCGEDVKFKPEICADIEPGKEEDAKNPLYGPNGILTRAISGLSLVIGVIAVLVIIVAGIQMTLSTGDAGKVKQSRDAVIYAAVGLIVAVLAQAIVRFVLNRINVGGG